MFFFRKQSPNQVPSSDFTYHFAGIAGCDAVRRNVFHDYTSGTDRHIVTYGDTRNYGDGAADPYIVSDGDRFCVLHEGIPFVWVYRMSCRVDADIRGDEDIVAYGDFRLIQYGEVEVREEIFPYLDIRAVVAVERLDKINVKFFPVFPSSSFSSARPAVSSEGSSWLYLCESPLPRASSFSRAGSVASYISPASIFSFSVIVISANRQYSVHNVFLLSSPWQASEVFLVMQFYCFPATSHQGIPRYSL